MPGRGLITEACFGRTILDSLAERVRQSPDAEACADDNARLTYRDLLTGAQRLAAEIIARGTPPGPLGIMVTGGISTMVAIYASLAAGRPLLLLDPAHPADRNHRLLQQIAASLMVGDHDAPARDGLPPTCAVTHAFSPHPLPAQPPPRPLGPDDVAFLVATSGSTGAPKCLAISQRSLLGRLEAHVNAATHDRDDVVGCLSSAAVVGGLYTLVGFSLAGVPVRMIDLAKGGFRSLFALVRKDRITILRGGVSILRAIAGMPDAAHAFAGLRTLTVYGEALSRADAALMRGVLPPGCRILTAYGSTETSGTIWYASPDDDHDPVRTPAGYVRPGTEIMIADDDGRPVPVGEVGELWIRSFVVALGQWRDGRLVTGEPAPDPEDPSRRIHHTGDLARITADGVVVVLGRKDRMVQVNGQRVEPAEVEAALRAIPGVTDAVVLPRTEGLQPMLVGFAASRTVTAAAIRAALRLSLPPHMVPARITVLDAIPMLPTGKPDAGALLGLAGTARV